MPFYKKKLSINSEESSHQISLIRQSDYIKNISISESEQKLLKDLNPESSLHTNITQKTTHFVPLSTIRETDISPQETLISNQKEIALNMPKDLYTYIKTFTF